MIRFVIRRLLQTIPVLIGLSLLLFMWVRALPGDPARSLLGRLATPENVKELNERLGLDKSLPEQYLVYVGQMFTGNFGRSIQDGRPVVETFAEKLPATLQLAVLALIIAVAIGLPVGYLAAKYRGRWIDTVLVSGSLVGVVMPVFFLAILLRLVFAEWLGWLPTGGQQDPRLDATHVTNFYVLDGILTGEFDAAWDALLHLILPSLALGTMAMAVVARITRASVSEVFDEDYVRTARSKGLASSTISTRHILRNALLPVVTTIGLLAGMLLSGSVLTETVFSFNGIGSYLFQAISANDYPVIQAFVLMIAVFYILINLAVDLAYGFIDPRVRVS